jgi:hypothetical protein
MCATLLAILGARVYCFNVTYLARFGHSEQSRMIVWGFGLSKMPCRLQLYTLMSSEGSLTKVTIKLYPLSPTYARSDRDELGNANGHRD